MQTSKDQNVFLNIIFGNDVKIVTLGFDQFNASLLNKSVIFFQNK